MDFIFGKGLPEDGHRNVDKSKHYIEQMQLVHQEVQEQLEKRKSTYTTRHVKHRFDHDFQVGDQVCLYIRKEILQGEGKKIKPIKYGPFKILEKIGNNDFRLDLPPYMKIYSIVNVANLRLHEPLMIDDHEENVHIPSIEYFSPEYLNELQEDSILDKRIRTSCKGNVEYLRVGLKGTNPTEERCIEIVKVRELYHHLLTK